MAEEATKKEMPKDSSSTPLNTIPNQELSSSEIAKESESKKSMDDLNQETLLERSIQPSELATIAKSSDMTAADEVDAFLSSDEDYFANVRGKYQVKDFLSKFSEAKVHTTDKCEGKIFESCDIESSHKVMPQVFEPKRPSIETGESDQLNVDITSEVSNDNVHREEDMSTCETDCHQELCIEDLVKMTTSDQDHEIKYSSSTRHRLGWTVHLSQENKLLRNLLKIAVPLENVQNSSNIQVTTEFAEKGDQKLELPDDSKSDELKTTQLKKTLKDIDLLLSCIEEIGRMNETFKNEVVKLLSEIMLLRRSSKYIHECLTVLQTFPRSTILFEESDRHPEVRVNVYDFGVDLLHDHSQLFQCFKELLTELNEYRLKFVELSENFSLIPFEFHVGESQSKVLDMTFEAAVKIYEDFFENDGYEILHEEYVIEHEELKKVALEFDIYLKRLGLYCDI